MMNLGIIRSVYLNSVFDKKDSDKNTSHWLSNKSQKVVVCSTLVLGLMMGVLSPPTYSADENTKERYQIYCESCHSVAGSEAPQAFTARDWKQRKAEGIEKMLEKVIVGIGNMPPQGMCIECTEEDLRKLIFYMSENQ